VDFYDVEGLAEQAVKVLRDPGKHRPLAAAAWKRIREKYGLQHCVDQLVQLFEETVARGPMTV
jgi:glycosyltransferase involved in cell wall biosynthesis